MKVGTDAVLLGAWTPITPDCKNILDIGTGTGVIALLAAARSSEAKVIGIEIDSIAAKQAAENAAASPYADRLTIEPIAIQDYLPSNSFDVIISNPPFFSGGVLSEQLDRQTARHTVKMPHHDLLRFVQRHLSPNGQFCVILPKIEGLRFLEVAASFRLHPSHTLRMRPFADQPVNRLCLALGHAAEVNPIEREIVQYEAPGVWTEDFRDLVGPFYPPLQ